MSNDETVSDRQLRRQRQQRSANFEPTETERDEVVSLSERGATWKQVANHLGISEFTARKHFMEEWQAGRDKAHLTVGSTIYNMAVGNNKDGTPNAKRAPDRVMAIFYAKSQMGWTEARYRLRDKDGNAVSQEQLERVLANMTPQELDMYEQFLEKLALAGSDAGEPQSGESAAGKLN